MRTHHWVRGSLARQESLVLRPIAVSCGPMQMERELVVRVAEKTSELQKQLEITQQNAADDLASLREELEGEMASAVEAKEAEKKAAIDYMEANPTTIEVIKEVVREVVCTARVRQSCTAKGAQPKLVIRPAWHILPTAVNGAIPE